MSHAPVAVPHPRTDSTLRALRRDIQNAIEAGRLGEALRSLRTLTRAAPWDLDARLLVADVLMQLAEPDLAEPVYRATAIAALQGGHGLRAAVAAKAAEAIEPSNGRLVDLIAATYSGGSSRVARVGTRLPIDDLDRAAPPAITIADDERAAAAQAAASLDDLPRIASPLSRAVLLSDLSAKGARDLLRASALRRVRRGQMLIAPGCRPLSVGLVARGMVTFFDRRAGVDEELGHSGEGALIGHESLIGAVPLRYGLRAASDVDLLEVPHATLAQLACRDPVARSRLGHVLREQFLQIVVRTSPLFVALPMRDRFELLRRMRPRTVPGGTLLVRRGEAPSELALVIAGEMEVFLGQPAASGLVEKLRPGDLVGILAALGGSSPQTTIAAATATTLLTLGLADVRKLTNAYPAAFSGLERMAERRRVRLGHGGQPAGPIVAVERDGRFVEFASP